LIDDAHIGHWNGSETAFLIEEVAKALVDNPESVLVTEISGTATSLYELTVAKSDIGQIIGTGGHTLAALRTILTALGTKLNRKAILEVLE
jgi:predicted RNA-binding protein YlqC (UPF0109 family)